MSGAAKLQARRCALQAMYEMDQGAGPDSLAGVLADDADVDRKSTRLNSSHRT